MNPTQYQMRLYTAKESLMAYSKAEDAARKALAQAVRDRRGAKEKYDALFLAE